VKARQRFTDDVWRSIFHPDENRYVGGIFGAIWQAASLVRAAPFKNYEKQFGLKKKDKRDIANDQVLFSKVFHYVSQVLAVPVPEVYLQAEQPGDIFVANIEEKGSLVPAIVVRQGVLTGRTEKEIAFAAARQLTLMRPEHYLKLALPSNTELKTAFLSALIHIQPNFPLKPDQVALVQQYLPLLRSKLQPQWIEILTSVVKKFLQNPTEIDLVKWGNAVEATAHRVGFVVCGDLEVAARLVSAEPAQVGAPQPKDKVKELIMYSISEDYFTIRQHLGTVIQ
jgi:golgin subfamily B member 1